MLQGVGSWETARCRFQRAPSASPAASWMVSTKDGSSCRGCCLAVALPHGSLVWCLKKGRVGLAELKSPLAKLSSERRGVAVSLVRLCSTTSGDGLGTSQLWLRC